MKSASLCSGVLLQPQASYLDEGNFWLREALRLGNLNVENDALPGHLLKIATLGPSKA